MESLQTIKQKLYEVYAQKRNCEANIFVLFILAFASLCLLALTFANHLFFLSEFTAFVAVATISSFALWGILFFIYKRVKQPGNFSDISEQVETLTREYSDSLNTVANMIDQNKAVFSNIEMALIKNTTTHINKKFDIGILRPKTYAKWFSLLLIAFLISNIIIIQDLNLLKKSYWGFNDWTSDFNTYFKIEPGNFRTRNGSTVKITAQLTREKIVGAPVIVTVLKLHGSPEKIFMRHMGNNIYEASVYDIQETLRYFVSNANSTSPTFQISTFEIPEIREKEIMVEPNPYTGLPLQKLTEFEYITVPEFSRIQIKIVTNKPIDAFFKNKGKLQPFTKLSKLVYLYEFRVSEYTEYSLFLTDEEKHEYETNPEWVIETIPDLPPSAEIKEPANDKKVLGIEELEFKYLLSDDYGISKAYIIFQTPEDGLVSIPLVIRKTESNKGIMFEDSISVSLLNLSLQNGDIISYYIKLWDNKTTGKHGEKVGENYQVNVSAVKFLTIVPGKMEKEDKPPQEGQGKEFRIDDLIAESKRIYRNSIPLQFKKNTEANIEQSVIIANALGDLKTNTSLRFTKLSELLMGQVPPEISNLFLEIGGYLGNAEKNMRSNAIETSLQYQMMALQTLFKLAKYLEQDSSESDQPPEEPSSSDSENQKDAKKNNKEKKDELKKKVQDWLNKLEDLKERNAGVNNQLKKTGDNLSEDEKKYFAEKKKEIKSQMQAVTEEMQSHHQVFPVADHLNNANREITNEEFNLTKGQKQTAMKHGVKTDFFMNQALQQLKAIKKEMDQTAMQQAQKSASDLIKKQNDIKEKTKGSSDAKEQSQLSKEQENLKEDLKKLQDTIKEAIQQTETNAPQASSELEKSLNILNQENIDQKMGKSSKSIFYGLKDKAGQEQNGILKGLQSAMEQIEKASESMSDADKQQLMKTLAQLGEIKENSKDASEKQKAQDIMTTIQDMGGASTPQFLIDTVKLAEQIKDSEKGKDAGITADQLLMEAMTLIEKKLKAMEMKDQVRKKMNQQMPPEVYKKMVEEYFQNLNKKNQ